MIGLSQLRASAWKYAAIALAVLAVAAFAVAVFFWSGRLSARVRADTESRRAEAVSSELRAVKDTLATERRRAQDMADIAETFEGWKRDAEADQNTLVADLRAGNKRLQDRWTGCVSDAAASAAERDAAARDREESAARIVRAARDADDQIRALQDVVKADRK